MTNPDQEFIARDQAGMIGCGCRILSEPEGKNTLPAVYYGMREIGAVIRRGEGRGPAFPITWCMPVRSMRDAALEGRGALPDTWLVLFGGATGPHTGFGHIRPGPDLGGRMPWDSLRRNPTSPPQSGIRGTVTSGTAGCSSSRPGSSLTSAGSIPPRSCDPSRKPSLMRIRRCRRYRSITA